MIKNLVSGVYELKIGIDINYCKYKNRFGIIVSLKISVFFLIMLWFINKRVRFGYINCL